MNESKRPSDRRLMELDADRGVREDGRFQAARRRGGRIAGCASRWAAAQFAGKSASISEERMAGSRSMTARR